MPLRPSPLALRAGQGAVALGARSDGQGVVDSSRASKESNLAWAGDEEAVVAAIRQHPRRSSWKRLDDLQVNGVVAVEGNLGAVLNLEPVVDAVLATTSADSGLISLGGIVQTSDERAEGIGAVLLGGSITV